MIRKDNPHVREDGQPEALLPKDGTTFDPKNEDRGGRKRATEGHPNVLAEEKSIGVVFDLADPIRRRVSKSRAPSATTMPRSNHSETARSSSSSTPAGARRLP